MLRTILRPSILLTVVALVLAGCAAPAATNDTATPPATTAPAGDGASAPSGTEVTATDHPYVATPAPADSTQETAPTTTTTTTPTGTGTAEPETVAPAPASAPAPEPVAPAPSPEPTPSTPVPRGPPAVDLRSAGGFVILSKSGISTTGTTAVLGDIGVSPIGSTAITGFGLIMDASNEFATSSLVTGNAYASDYTAPTPTRMTQAVSDMELAYTDAAGRTDPTTTELGAGHIGGMTIAPGLHKWGTAVTVLSDLTLEGGPDDVWIFQIAQTLDVASGVQVTLAGGAQAKNVFWQVADQVTLDTTSAMKGNLLSYSAIVLKTGATLDGRALSQTAVTLDANAVTKAA